MKARSYQIPALLSQIQKDFDVVLFYGTDEGEIQHAFSVLKKEFKFSKESLHFITLSKEDLKKTPFLATDEANSISLIQGKKYLYIPEDASFSAQALTHFLDNKQTDALLIIKAGNLIKSNALRVEAEKNPRILAVACYEPTEAIQKMVISHLHEHNKTIPANLLPVLVQKIGINQQVILQELDKLVLYMGDKTAVDLKMIQSCLTDTAQPNEENFCIALADGRVADVEKAISYFANLENSFPSLLWGIRDYFERLLKIVSDSSEPLPQIVKKNLRPAQFRLERPLTLQANFWKTSDILKVLDRLNLLEKSSRTTGYPESVLFSKTLLDISLFAKKLRSLR